MDSLFRNDRGDYTVLTEAEVQMVDVLGDNVDEFVDILEEAAFDAVLYESFDSSRIGEKFKKAWDKIVEFFKKCKDYIEKKIKGHVDDLSIEFDKKDGDSILVFYAKNKLIKTITLDSSDKYTCVNMKDAHDTLKSIISYIDKNALRDEDGKREELSDLPDKKEFTKAMYDEMNKDGTYGNHYRYFANNVETKDIKGTEGDLKKYVQEINQYYNKTINMIYSVSNKAVKKEKKAPNQRLYKIYVAAKNVASKSFNYNSLIRKQGD